MSDKPEQHAKPDGSAWKAHMDGLSERNARTRKEGRKEREDHEREKTASHRAAELRQMVALNRTTGSHGKSHRP
jgi:hypothetical protein